MNKKTLEEFNRQWPKSVPMFKWPKCLHHCKFKKGDKVQFPKVRGVFTVVKIGRTIKPFSLYVKNQHGVIFRCREADLEFAHSKITK